MPAGCIRGDAMGTDSRSSAIVTDLVAGLRELIRRHRVSYAEYRDAVGFLARTVEAGEQWLLCDVLFESVVDEVAERLTGGTESNVEGPFYIPGAPLVDGCGVPPALPMRAGEPGDLLLFSGAVRSTTGAGLSNAVLDIWQADAEGLYSRFAPDLPEWNLRGRVHADDEGRFAFRTVVPAAYDIPKHPHTARVLELLGLEPHRPAHVHVKVGAPGHQELTTQVYFAGDPWLDCDVVGAVKPALVAQLRKVSEPDNPHYRCEFNFELAPSPPSSTQ
jgi:catechol 1,2-dioxygenase